MDSTIKDLQKEMRQGFQKVDKQFEDVKGDIKALDKSTHEIFGRVEKDVKELTGKVDWVGSLISNTHQEVKNFTKTHEILDTRVADLERRMTHLEHLVKA